jgi:uncharacterized protein (DUF39 family)
MGILLPRFGNVTYSTSGQLSPLLNDPEYRTIGIGTRIFLGGAIGYVAWEGTQHNPMVERDKNKLPVKLAGTIAVIGNLKDMSREFIRGAIFEKYGVSLFVGIGIPIPILDEEMTKFVSIKDENIYGTIVDYSVQRRNKPTLGKVSYKELRSGKIILNGKEVPTAPMSSYKKAREIAQILKNWLKTGQFLIQEPIQPLPLDTEFKPLDVRGKEEL